jgi:hypothetical protein
MEVALGDYLGLHRMTECSNKKLGVGGSKAITYTQRYLSEYLFCQCHRSWAAAGSTKGR